MKKLILLVILCTIFPLAVFASKADDNTGADDTQILHVYSDVNLISTLKFTYDKPRIVIKSVFPQLESYNYKDGIETFNQLVMTLIQSQIDEYKKQVSAVQDVQKIMSKDKRKNDLYIDYAASFIQAGKNPIISIRFSIQGYIAGMAHPYHHHLVLNFDLNNNKKIDLSDLFKPDANYLVVLSNYTSKALSRRLSDQQMITEGTAPTVENFKNWNVKPNGLVFTFDEYQVAPYVYGAQTILVPFAILKNLIDPESPIASCVKRKRKSCTRGLVTGGFIDEASNILTIDPEHRTLNPILSKR